MRAVRIVEAMFGSLLAGVVRRMTPTMAKGVAVALGVLLVLLLQWWQQQSQFLHLVIIGFVVGLVVLWLRHRWFTRRAFPQRRRRTKPVAPEASQVLYRWWEPDDLPEGATCYCGKSRRAGELVYVGITGAHRSRELDDDRQASCWWRDGLVGTTEVWSTRTAVEAAEEQAIKSERPRENKVHNRVSQW